VSDNIRCNILLIVSLRLVRQLIDTYVNNNRPSSDNCIVTNPYTSFDDDASANINVLADKDFSSYYSAITAFETLRIS
jgi:hypothetical protein